MIDFAIIEINEAIDGLSYEVQFKYQEEKETKIREELEAKELLLSDIMSLKDEIETEKNDEMYKQILQALKGDGYNMELDCNGNLSFPLGLANITIIMQFLDAKVDFSSTSSQKQLKSVNLSAPFCLSSKQMEISTVWKCQKKTFASAL